MLGLPVAKTPSEAFMLAAMMPIKYTCLLTTASGMMFQGSVVTHLELDLWADWKGYQVFDLEKAELALPHERTSIG